MTGTIRAYGLRLASVLVIFAVGGCLDYEESIEARADGSGTIAFHYKIPVLLVGFTGRDNPNAWVPLSFDEKDLRALVAGAGLRVSSLEVFDRDAERHVRLVIDLDSIEDLKRLPRVRGHEFAFETDSASGDWIFRRSIRLVSVDAAAGPVGWLALELARLRFSCRLPWTIRATNADDSGSEMRWERRLSDLVSGPFVMSVRVVPPSFLHRVAVAAGHPLAWAAIGVMMLSGAGIVAVRKRRRRTASLGA